MEDQIKQSLYACQEDSYPTKHQSNSNRYNKSNSFTELSDWGNRHRYINESIVLPRIMENPFGQQPRREVESQMSSYEQVRKRLSPSGIKSVDIKFGLPQGLKGFQKSFYENYIKQKEKRKGSKLKPSEYISLQQQLRSGSPNEKLNKIHSLGITNREKSEHETARQSIINRVMNRKNRLKKQHFLQEYLVSNQMGVKVRGEQAN